MFSASRRHLFLLTHRVRWRPLGLAWWGRSLTTHPEADPQRADAASGSLADVAQPVARNVSTVEVEGSIPSVCSIWGVPVHKHRTGPVCMCASAAAPACSDALSLVACGDSPDGRPAPLDFVEVLGPSSRRGGFDFRTGRQVCAGLPHFSEAPRRAQASGGGNRPPTIGVASEPVTDIPSLPFMPP